MKISNTSFVHNCPIHLLVYGLLVDGYVPTDRMIEIQYLARLFPHLQRLVNSAIHTEKGWYVPKHIADSLNPEILDPDFDTKSFVFLANRTGPSLVERDNDGQFIIYTGVYDLAHIGEDVDDDLDVISHADIQKAIG